MELEQLNRNFAVCKLESAQDIDFSKAFTFLSITDDEISLVCEERFVPANITAIEKGWKGLKISGMLDFGMIGVIAKIAGLLAEQKISIFVISTFNTDYILLKSEHYEKAIAILRQNEYRIR